MELVSALSFLATVGGAHLCATAQQAAAAEHHGGLGGGERRPRSDSAHSLETTPHLQIICFCVVAAVYTGAVLPALGSTRAPRKRIRFGVKISSSRCSLWRVTFGHISLLLYARTACPCISRCAFCFVGVGECDDQENSPAQRKK